MELTAKQSENVRLAHKRWNVCEGAVRSGKSWLACNFTIPDRITAMAGLPGIPMILGVSLGNIERNVLGPMRETFGAALVGGIRGPKNTAQLFGQEIYCLGAQNSAQVAKLQGAAVKFCYCDELAALNKDVFDMLKSRLSFGYSECHAACNPEGPRHWLKQFLDSQPAETLYRQQYCIDDNPHLDPGFVAALKAEYAGTVYFNRYILGQWAQAEGLVYQMWEQAVEPAYQGEARRVCCSMDYGTQNATCCLMWAEDPGGVWHAIGEYWHSGRDTGVQKTDAEYTREIERWARGLLGDAWPGKLKIAIDPSAASIQAEMSRCGAFRVLDADNSVLEGIETVASALHAGVVKIGDCCKHLVEELGGYVWEDRQDGIERPVKVNDHGCDALRYGVMTFGMYKRRRAVQ